jgi:hypothetical protein
VPLHRQQELNTYGCLGVPTSNNWEDSNVANTEGMQWVPSIYPSVIIGVTEDILHRAAKMFQSTITYVPYSNDFQWYTFQETLVVVASKPNSKTCWPTKQSSTRTFWLLIYITFLFVLICGTQAKVFLHFSVTQCIQIHFITVSNNHSVHQWECILWHIHALLGNDC